jgi:hypothetical protein
MFIALQELLDQIDAASDAYLYYVAFASALTVPDMCAGLEASRGNATGARYRAWFDKWVGPRYMRAGEPTLDGDAWYRLRCSLLHQGSAFPEGGRFTRVLFIEPTSGILVHNNVMDDALNIDVKVFCRDITESARAWLATVIGTEPFETNSSRFIRRHSYGLPDYIRGVPVIA